MWSNKHYRHSCEICRSLYGLAMDMRSNRHEVGDRSQHRRILLVCRDCLSKLSYAMKRGYLRNLELFITTTHNVAVEITDDKNQTVSVDVPMAQIHRGYLPSIELPYSAEVMVNLLSRVLNIYDLKHSDVQFLVLHAPFRAHNWKGLLEPFFMSSSRAQQSLYKNLAYTSCHHCELPIPLVSISTPYVWQMAYGNDPPQTAMFCSENCYSQYTVCAHCSGLHLATAEAGSFYNPLRIRGMRRSSTQRPSGASSPDPGSPLSPGMLRPHGGWYCKSCIEFNQVPCVECGRQTVRFAMHQVGAERFVCDDCLGHYQCNCYSCGMDGYRFTFIASHNPLLNEEVFYCDRCSQLLANRVYQHNYRPRRFFYHGDTPPFYGVEIEVDHFPVPFQGVARRMVEKFSPDETVFYAKRDGSLNNGFEFVFHPRTLKKWVELESMLDTILNEVVSHGGQAFEHNTCGLHVHRSRTDLQSRVLQTKMVMLLKSLKAYINRFSLRESGRYAGWNAFDESMNTPSPARGNSRWPYRKQAYKLIKEGGHLRNRYQSVNFGSNRDTVEFRTYRGTVWTPKLFAFIGFSHYLVEFAKHTTVGELNQFQPHVMWEIFIEYLLKYNKLLLINNILDHIFYHGIFPDHLKAGYKPIIQDWRMT